MMKGIKSLVLSKETADSVVLLMQGMRGNPLDRLIRQAQQGDEAAFEQLVNSCYDSMFRYAMKWAGNRANAEDITHQACLKLARGLQQFRFDSAFNTWLYRLVINCAKDWQKANRRFDHVDLSEAEEAGRPDNPDSEVHLRQVLNQIDALGGGYRETVVLVFGEGLSHREAAAILDVKESTISWRIHEIRQRLSPQAEGGS
jgi:RNA polymerase sigma-70 factor (ECF subfamily)